MRSPAPARGLLHSMRPDTMRQTAGRLEMRHGESPTGMAHAFDEEEERLLRAQQALHEGGRRLRTSMVGAAHERRCSGDWLYALFFDYERARMDDDLDAAIDFVLRKHAIGVWRPPTAAAPAGQMLPPIALHPHYGAPAEELSLQPAAQLQLPPHIVADTALQAHPRALAPQTDCPVLAPLPDALRASGDAQALTLFRDTADRWFVRDTLRRLRALPPACTLYKRFFLLMAVALEPELYEQVVGGCPSERLFGDPGSEGEGREAGGRTPYSYQALLRELSRPLFYNFTRYNAEQIVRGFLLRAMHAYESGGAVLEAPGG